MLVNCNRVLWITLLLLINSCNFNSEKFWAKEKNNIYGAKPNEIGPIGGGSGYTNYITEGDFTVHSVDELITALDSAKSGDIVYIPGEVTLNLTARIYIEDLVLKIPEGVILASNRGHKESEGALLFSDALDTPALIRATGPDVRVTGLRIRGPNPRQYLAHHRRSFGEDGRGRSYYYQLPTSRGIETKFEGLIVDNCEIWAFSHAAIYLDKGRDHHIHHNNIHHNQYHGLGYGVSLNRTQATIEYNRFNFNRHSIAGTGRPGCSYVARHNIVGPEASSHAFDMHGGPDRNDGTDIAGTTIQIYNNTFLTEQLPIKIRGVPEREASVYNNWFPKHSNISDAIQYVSNIRMDNNLLAQ